MRQNILIAVGVVIILLVSLIFSEWMSMSIGMLVHEAKYFSSYFKCNEIKKISIKIIDLCQLS